MESWIQKHEPKSVTDLIGRRSAASELYSVFQQDPGATVVVTGPSSCGKTTFVELVLQTSLGFAIRKYDSITHRNDRLLDHMRNLNRNSVVERLRTLGGSSVPPTPTALLIDNLDTISLSSEKNIIDAIISTNTSHRLFPLVLIMNTNRKLLDDMKGITKIITLEPLTCDQLTQVLQQVCEKERVVFENKECVADLVAFVQGDIRLLLTVLQDIHMCFSHKEVTREVLHHFLENNTKTKNLDRHLFDSLKSMLMHNGQVAPTLAVYNTDKVLLPLLLQENFHKDIQNRCMDADSTAMRVSEYVSQGDIIETYIYTDQNWYLQDMHCFTSCTAPLNIMSRDRRYVCDTEVAYPLTFSSELNKTSLKNINRKNINMLCSSSNIHTDDLHHVSSLFNELIKSGKFDTARDIAMTYSEDPVKFIETVIKINKCNSSLAPVGSRIKKLISPPKSISENAGVIS